MEAPNSDTPGPPAQSGLTDVGSTHDSTHVYGGQLTLDEARATLAAARAEADALRSALENARATEHEAANAARERDKAHEQLKVEMAARQREQRQAHIERQGAARE